MVFNFAISDTTNFTFRVFDKTESEITLSEGKLGFKNVTAEAFVLLTTSTSSARQGSCKRLPNR